MAVKLNNADNYEGIIIIIDKEVIIVCLTVFSKSFVKMNWQEKQTTAIMIAITDIDLTPIAILKL